ncbi:MAG: helix-hairpin-helix domain-containing protein, partial [Myxococcaceae bacterium]|nr:helix-hairpin-helix domain-containing protein [Myxococcaceae bacterium]
MASGDSFALRRRRMARPNASLLLLFALSGVCLPARAPAQVPEAQAETEAELEALVEDGLLAEEAQPALSELLREGVDLSTAPREVLATLPGLSRADVEALLLAREQGARGTDVAQVLAPAQRSQLAPFLRASDGAAHALSGRARLATVFAATDGEPPPALLQLRLAVGTWLSAGLVLASTRQQPGEVRWDEARHELWTT